VATIDIDEVRTRLLQEKESVASDLDKLRADLGRSIEDAVEEDGNDSHPGDVATETYDREMEMTLEETLERRLEEIESALQRVDEGTYGICEVCGKPIDPERLEALPYATKCIEDKRREERS
jgi:DnaK suppressor protein